MSLDRDAITARIGAILTAHTTPRFTVFEGEPLGLGPDGSPFACFWYLGDTDPPEGGMTFTNVMVMERFQIICFWHRVLEIGSLPGLEAEIWSANRTLKAAFRADSTLNGAATDIDITDSQVDYGVFPLDATAMYRTLEFELLVKSLEEEAISA